MKSFSYLLTAVLLGTIVASMFGCSEVSPTGIDREIVLAGEADASVALAMATIGGESNEKESDDGDEPKPGDKCPHCDGTGESGDGQGDCPYCEGGRVRDDAPAIFGSEGPATPPAEPEPAKLEQAANIEPKPEATPEPPAVVTLFVLRSEAHGWPKRWWFEEGPKLKAAGFKVKLGTELESGPSRIEASKGDAKGEFTDFATLQEIVSSLE